MEVKEIVRTLHVVISQDQAAQASVCFDATPSSLQVSSPGMDEEGPCEVPVLYPPFIFRSLCVSPPCSASYCTGNRHVSLQGEDFSDAIYKDQWLWKALCGDCDMGGKPKIATALKSFSEYYKCFNTFIVLTLCACVWLRKGMCTWVRYHSHGRGLQSPGDGQSHSWLQAANGLSKQNSILWVIFSPNTSI